MAGINLDRQPPALDIVVPAVASVADTVHLSCVATDELSGVAEATCADSIVAATSFEEGVNAFTFSARDQAGNVTSRTVEVTLVVTATGVAELAGQYLGNSPGTAGIVNSLRVKLQGGKFAQATSELRAQCCAPTKNKRFTSDQVAELTRFIAELQD